MKRYPGARFGCPLSPWVILLVGLSASLCGCANPKGLFIGTEDTGQVLRERISKVWKAKQDGDCATIYAYACSNYRKNISEDQHAARPCKGNFENFRIVDIELKSEDTLAWATIRFDTESQGFLIKGAQIKEVWIKEDGKWLLDLPIMQPSPFGF